MYPFVQKNIFSVVAVAVMLVVSLFSSVWVIAIQAERDRINADVRRMNGRIKTLKNKELLESKVQLERICNATTVRERAQHKGFGDADRMHVIHVRTLNVPYGRSSGDPDPRAEAIALASIEPNSFGASGASARQ